MNVYEKALQLLNYQYMMEHKGAIINSLIEKKKRHKCRIAVLCGSTFGIAEDFIRVFLLLYGIDATFMIGDYNRIYEDACFDNKKLAEFSPDFILVHSSNRNLIGGFDRTSDDVYRQDITRLEQIWESLKSRYHCAIIQNNYEYYPYRIIGNAARSVADGNVRYIDRMNAYISAYAEKNKSFFINDIGYLSSYYGLSKWYDNKLWDLFKYPISMDALPMYAKSIASIIKSVLGCNKKLVVTDLDNTLWKGEIAEEGVDGIQVGCNTSQGQRYNRVQRYLKCVTKQGVVLAINSKNDDKAGMEGLSSSESVLKESDFISRRINWNDKASNMEEILKDVNITSESTVFIDDMAMERDIVHARFPDIICLDSTDADQLLVNIDLLSLFEVTDSTDEDIKRNELYVANNNRNEFEHKYKDYEEYLRALDMKCIVTRINEKNISRVTQLLNKTNQFNFTTRRYTMDEVRMKNREVFSVVLELTDRFGSNGIVSIAMIRFIGTNAYIEDWIMSCRVFRRGLEYTMMRLICDECKRRRATRIFGYYRKTEKNNKLSDFFVNLGFNFDSHDDESDEDLYIGNDIDRIVDKCPKSFITIERM